MQRCTHTLSKPVKYNKTVCWVCWGKGKFFFSVRLKPGRLLVWNYWCHLITIWRLRVKKWESLRVIENRRHAGSRWGCFISLIQPFLKPDPHLDPSDTWSNKSLCARILLVKFSKTCNQESEEWSAEQHSPLLGNKKPTGVPPLLSLLLKRRSTVFSKVWAHLSGVS